MLLHLLKQPVLIITKLNLPKSVNNSCSTHPNYLLIFLLVAAFPPIPIQAHIHQFIIQGLQLSPKIRRLPSAAPLNWWLSRQGGGGFGWNQETIIFGAKQMCDKNERGQNLMRRQKSRRCGGAARVKKTGCKYAKKVRQKMTKACDGEV